MTVRQDGFIDGHALIPCRWRSGNLIHWQIGYFSSPLPKFFAWEKTMITVINAPKPSILVPYEVLDVFITDFIISYSFAVHPKGRIPYTFFHIIIISEELYGFSILFVLQCENGHSRQCWTYRELYGYFLLFFLQYENGHIWRYWTHLESIK